MRIPILITALLGLATTVAAQRDSILFRGTLHNEEYKTYLRLNLFEQDVQVPGQDFYGALPGYLGRDRYSYVWPVVEATVKNGKARLTLVNDYGSEDAEAELVIDSDSTAVFTQVKGSPIKVPDNGKWLKLPKKMHLKLKKLP